MPTPVHFDRVVGAEFLRYARMAAARGYLHITLGNIAMRTRSLTRLAPRTSWPRRSVSTRPRENKEASDGRFGYDQLHFSGLPA